MTPIQKRKHIETLMIMIEGAGFTKDNYGSWRKDHKGETYRIKVKSINIRIERKSGSIWFNIVSKPIVQFTLVDMAKFISRFSD